MQRLLVIAAALALHIATVGAQPNPKSAPAIDLSIEQQIKVGDILTKDAGWPLPSGQVALVVGGTVPASVALKPIPASVDGVVPGYHGRSYIAVEEQIAIVDPQTRVILAVMQRVQEQTTGSTGAPKQ